MGGLLKMGKYAEELKKAMDYLGSKDDTIFLGQTVEYNGSPMFPTFKDIKKEKKIEMPVAENMQMGISIGLALEGFVPISVYPRIDFLICAIDQLVNHLDKIEEMSHGEFRPGVIIRTQIGNKEPLFPGVQHCSDYTVALKKMCKSIYIYKPSNPSSIMRSYKIAYERAKRGYSTIIIEAPQGGDPKNTNTPTKWQK